MTSFAPGTNPDYAAAFNNWWFGGGQQRGEPAPNRQSFGADSGGGQRFRPGMAQPIAPSPTGTPYGGGEFGGGQGWNEPVPLGVGGEGRPRGGEGGRGGEGFGGRPAPFTQTLNTPFGQMDPGQYYQQRDAFIQSANSQQSQYMPGGSMAGQAPQWNPNQMWGQAGRMVQQGWQNPMAQSGGYNSASYYRPDGTYDYAASKTAWNQQHKQQIGGQKNQDWLKSQSPANRKAYGLMQGMF